MGDPNVGAHNNQADPQLVEVIDEGVPALHG